MACFPPLPLDLLRPILLHIHSVESLLNVCLVSRTFLADAQACLYTDIAVRDASVVLLCRTISESPAFGPRVRRLSVQLSSTFSCMDQLGHTLRALPRLRDLEVTCPQPLAWVPAMFFPRSTIGVPWAHRDAARVLRQCNFRLRTFRSGFGMLHADLIAFLEEQDEIEHLTSFDPVCTVAPLAVDLLPRLKIFTSCVTQLQFQEAESGEKRSIKQSRLDCVMIDSARLFSAAEIELVSKIALGEATGKAGPRRLHPATEPLTVTVSAKHTNEDVYNMKPAFSLV
ncbi:hypothetical protein C8J57DRAFT_1524456 [Mycena rebaudengoi]|nr:hypothetical protein C8J57DRAFT_1524456 [Mycena rebaudengoi]